MNGFQVEEHGSGYAVTLRLHVGREEVGNAELTINFSKFLVGFEQGVMFPNLGTLGDTEAEDKQPAADPPSTARDLPAGRRAQRTRAARSAEPAPAADEAREAKPKARRRRPGVRKEEAKPDANPTDAAPSAGRRSRGRGARAAAGTPPASTTKSPSEDVSDEDLTRTASLAAADIGAPAVMDVLDKFDAAQVRDLTPEQRPKFVARLTELRERGA